MNMFLHVSSCLLFLQLHICWALLSKEEYCKLCNRHTMCKYNPGVRNRCMEVSRNIRQDVLNTLNDIRNRVALGKYRRVEGDLLPPAANMIYLDWDEELEVIARRWGQQCRRKFRQDYCRNISRVTYRGRKSIINVQQAISYSVGEIGGPQELIKGMMLGKTYFVSPMIRRYNPNLDSSREMRDTTPILWADNHLVGCVYLLDTDEEENSERMVCNFANLVGVAANTFNASVYKVGPARSACHPDYDQESIVFPGLCKNQASCISVPPALTLMLLSSYTNCK